jgi:Intracellular proteinase inhibitor
MRHLRHLAYVAIVLVGCSPAEVGTPGGAPGAPPLLPSVQARAFAQDSVTFTLQVTNTSSQPVELNFNSGQSFDFIVSRGQQQVWRWSDEQMFTQALRLERLGPGETLTHSATWRPGPARGDFNVVGRLTSRDHPAEQAATFRVE